MKEDKAMEIAKTWLLPSRKLAAHSGIAEYLAEQDAAEAELAVLIRPELEKLEADNVVLLEAIQKASADEIDIHVLADNVRLGEHPGSARLAELVRLRKTARAANETIQRINTHCANRTPLSSIEAEISEYLTELEREG